MLKSLKLIFIRLYSPNENIIFYIKLFNFFQRKKMKFFLMILQNRISNKFGVHIGINSKISESVKFPHPIGIVIGEGVEIGSNCIIYQNVTIGVANHKKDKFDVTDYPKIGNNVKIYPNSIVLGNIKIHDNIIIGAGALIKKSLIEEGIYIEKGQFLKEK